MTSPILLTTTDFVQGREIGEYLGVIQGVSVQRMTMGAAFAAMGTWINETSHPGAEDLALQTRVAAMQKLMAEAARIGAHGVVGMRFDVEEFLESGLIVVVYGTAVRFR